jgi:16S rRNA (uracil1498-N3)-methyltransferase
MQLFYCNTFDDDLAILNDDESRHCKVLRKSVSDILWLTDGLGHLFKCELHAFKGNSVVLKVLSKEVKERSRTYTFHLFISPTKQNDRMEWMLEKSVEAGLDSITFIETEHSEKHRINRQRLEKIVISAMKQSGQFHLTQINDLIKLEAIQFDGNALYAHCRSDDKKKELKDYQDLIQRTNNVSIVIGPEGDFSENELHILSNKGAFPLGLGKTRLRTETAGFYCSAVLNALF